VDGVNLLTPSELVRTGPVDHADWNYRALLGYLSRQRFALVDGLLPAGRVPRLLEIGYGSGIFLPHLAGKTDDLHGVDIHAQFATVAAALERRGIAATLRSADARELPYGDGFFDAIVAVSALEFVTDIAAAASEMRRVLRSKGELVCVMPSESPFLDAALRIVTRESAKNDYGERRGLVLPALLREFAIADCRRFPSWTGRSLAVYTAYRLTPRSTALE
jgi:ubiquinone/menaquinone biosynthesis C-methylase UbiE